MNNYETRLYALAVRAPISEVHIEQLASALVARIKSRLKEECDTMVSTWRILSNRKYSKCIPSNEFGGISIHRSINYYGLPYSRLDVSFDEVRDVIVKDLHLLSKGLAALQYAKSVINTPQEQVVLCLPVDEEVCKAILEMSTLEKNISEYLNTPFDKDSVLACVKEFLESIEQYEYKEPLHKEPSKDKVEYSKIAYPPMLEDEKKDDVKPSNPKQIFIWAGVLANIIILILILCI